MGVGIIEPWHLIVILAIALVVFGPRTLGDLGGSLGRNIRDFRRAFRPDRDVSKSDQLTDGPDSSSPKGGPATTNGSGPKV